MLTFSCLPILLAGCMASVLFAQQPDNGPAAQGAILHAYALAELGQHAEAVKAFAAASHIAGFAVNAAEVAREQSAVVRATKYTQQCAGDKSCEAEDFLAIGKPAEAIAWQKHAIQAIRDAQNAHTRKGEELQGGGMTVRLGDETDSTGGRSFQLADAYDLQARIHAAMGQTAAAVKDLDMAVKSLPDSAKSASREAGYGYHRALILAEVRQYAKAAAACTQSSQLDATSTVLGERRSLQCAAIEMLASGNVTTH